MDLRIDLHLVVVKETAHPERGGFFHEPAILDRQVDPVKKMEAVTRVAEERHGPTQPRDRSGLGEPSLWPSPFPRRWLNNRPGACGIDVDESQHLLATSTLLALAPFRAYGVGWPFLGR